jgi:hypothetical protein
MNAVDHDHSCPECGIALEHKADDPMSCEDMIKQIAESCRHTDELMRQWSRELGL